MKFLDPYLPMIYIAAFCLAVLGVWAYGHRQYTKGYDTAKTEAAETVAKERVTEFLRQSRANIAAATAAQDTITKLDLSNEALMAKLKENNRDAKADPDADRECLSVDGVRRLNAIR